MARPDVLNRLKELGWDGPTSYTLPYLNEMISLLENGTTVEQLKESRRKTSVKVNKEPKGEWVRETVELESPYQGEFELDGVRWRSTDDGAYEKFVPEVKAPKVKAEKGEWVKDEPMSSQSGQLVAGEGEQELDGVKWRWTADGGYERFVPTPPKAKGKIKGQEASWDPREMLRAFENEDVRVRTGGRDWTMVDTDFLEGQLVQAQQAGHAAVVIDLDGSSESADVVWLEALVAVKKRLALREEVNGDGDSGTPTD